MRKCGFISHLDGVYQWLKYLAQRYKGNFHEPDLDMNDDFVEVNAAIPIGGGVTGSDEDDEIIEMKVKSQDTLLRRLFHLRV